MRGATVETHFAFDLDGTITREELLPLIAKNVGLQSEIQLLTKLTMDGTIPFEDSFRLRCAVLQSVPVSEVQEIVAEVELDGEIAAFIRENRDVCSVVTGNLDVWILPLLERLGCRFYSSRAQMRDDRLGRLEHIMHKSKPIHEIKQKAVRVVAVGDGANDVSMFEAADVGVAFGGVHQPAAGLVEISDYVTFDGGALCRLLNTL